LSKKGVAVDKIGGEIGIAMLTGKNQEILSFIYE